VGVYSVGHWSSYAVLFFMYPSVWRVLWTRSCLWRGGWWGEVFIIPLSIHVSIGLAFMVGVFSEGRQRWHSGRRCGRRLNGYCF
jgi:hypothetical protein